MNQLDKIIDENRNSGGAALPSVCSAHPDVLTASILLAVELDRPLLVEATSNQVNHKGGYTGLTPQDFITNLRNRAQDLGLRPELLLFGGDHLGPQAWKSQEADSAMAEAEQMIAAYVKAGFTKIHLDCSEGCKGEPAALSDGPAASRAAHLAKVAEEAAPDPSALRYIVGTEVPPPGGARHDDEGIAPTSPKRATATLKAHEEAFAQLGLQDAFSRVRGLVVQPGLEFAPAHIEHFPMESDDNLSSVLSPYPALCFEAHSTDYQYPEVYAELAKRHFAILKVGPALTFAWREALYALSHVMVWMQGGPHISEVMEGLMTDAPESWQGHYHGTPEQQHLLRHFGYADRIRYYWTLPKALEALHELKSGFDALSPPLPLLAQYFAPETLKRAETLDLSPATALLVAHVQSALMPYFKAEI
ncbi:class II D-tagatose-bisphosphate aldolase non-catalytic subunit [Celeribacter halophilus]|uniref:class II D-tagatose-bisphosphate aldolase non-catalytic subunit n=1 Tax=Celeribacter halophilus TaxID=576117 RepID=UPI001C0A5722|nr:class II D-tagatose-bisphosphate aldolase, non-catalytic subunit [Celeribacter halophilus]MBU2888076.1 class II D-tagatose-bisphosphate aldolase, non-catalytic subunit [Celeribacter halophilus]MDO6511847.1 class II D-tagatose-bisphosphate aldolase, non-catalytic subunit [Celeribacter halophilus]